MTTPVPRSQKCHPAGTVAVIFTSWRTDEDAAGYDAAATEMAALAARQPGYVGIDSARSADGMGITVSYWTSDAAAHAWRDHPRHTIIRETGRALWYARYTLHVAHVERGYAWP